MCEKVVKDVPWRLKYVRMGLTTQIHVPDHFKTQEMCEKSVEKDPWWLFNVPNRFKTDRMCEKAVQKNLLCLEYVPDHLKA